MAAPAFELWGLERAHVELTTSVPVDFRFRRDPSLDLKNVFGQGTGRLLEGFAKALAVYE